MVNPLQILRVHVRIAESARPIEQFAQVCAAI